MFVNDDDATRHTSIDGVFTSPMYTAGDDGWGPMILMLG